MATIKIKFRPSSAADKKGTLYYQVIHQRKVATVSTRCHIFPYEWDKSLNAISAAHSGNDKERKAVLQLYQSRIEWETEQMRRIMEEKENAGNGYSISELLCAFRNIPSCPSVFCYIQAQMARKIKMKCYGTAKTYASALCSFRKFRNGYDLSFGMMTCDLIQEYEVWMLHSGLKRNSVSCYLRTLRTLYHHATDEGLTKDNDVFRKVHISIGKTRKRAITVESVRAILNLDLSAKPSLAFARDIFMFSFYSRGMSFVDIAYLKKSDLSHGFLTYNRRKTFQSLTIQWERPMTAIVERYAEQTNGSPYFFPIARGEDRASRKLYEQTLQRVNRNLKTIGKMAGLDIPLTTYVARHSWASVARNMAIPLSVISEGLGHDSDKTTQIYLASLDTSMVNKANRKIISNVIGQKIKKE